ncbi:MAG: hypothetical protein GTN71_03420 [Anaerolineae bacterium]|nr:hypothetical protein [Anaerolineae bacterium]
MRALDEVTLVVELEGPTGYFPHLLVGHPSYPVPRHVVEAHGAAWMDAENIVTNGPFKLEAWKRSESLALVRNPEYRGPFTGNVQRVELFALEWSAALELYEADGLDVWDLWHVPPPALDHARQRHAADYVSSPWLATIFVGFDASRPPFDDPRVRRAFVHTIDRETLADMVMRGSVFPGTGGFVPPGMPGHSAGIALPHDPDRARRLLAEGAYPSGRGFPVVDALIFRGAVLNPGVTTTECNVPPLPELAIGHGWFSADEALRNSNWQAMTWELYLDGRQVELNAFGTYDADMPQTGLPGHDPNEEVITKLRSWDVVVGNPTAGAHTLRSVLHLSQQVDDGFHVTEAGTYDLVVNFTVEAALAKALPETGGTSPGGTLPLWLGAGGLLLLALGLSLRRAS